MADTEPLELSCLSRLHNHKEPGGKLLPILVQKDLLWVGGKKIHVHVLKNILQ